MNIGDEEYTHEGSLLKLQHTGAAFGAWSPEGQTALKD
jgi:hypothetical protein